ncbi:hypothetical protein S83_055028, partial [Arachis hypogaea]
HSIDVGAEVIDADRVLCSTSRRSQILDLGSSFLTSAVDTTCKACEFLSSLHLLSGHMGAILQRKGDLCGSLPVSVLAVYDAKLGSLCKYIDPEVESNPYCTHS